MGTPSNPRRHRRIAVIEVESSSDEDEVDANLVTLRNRVNRNIQGAFRNTFQKWQQGRDNTNSFYGQTTSAVLNYLTIKVLFWDIGIALGDTITDFCQAIALMSNEGKEIYGIITLAINWVPGIPAAVHLMSMYREQLPWQKTVLYATLLILLYPIVPVLAYINLLWKKPKDPNAVSKEFREAEFLATIAHAISGGIESPVQLMFQSWMIFNGVIKIKWNEIFSFSISDWQGNTIYLPMTASATLLFSIFSILKASLELNIIRVHVEEVSSWKKAVLYFRSISDHLAFISAETYFRIVSILVCVTYLNTFGFLPIAVAWIGSIIIGQRIYSKSLDFIPLWLISFISIFMPICFTSKDIRSDYEREQVVYLQFQTFKYLSIVSVISYGVCLIAIGVIVYLPYDMTQFQYNSEVIFDFRAFAVLILSLLLMGLIATLLSFRPTVTSFFKGPPTKPDKPQTTVTKATSPTRNPLLPDLVLQDQSHANQGGNQTSNVTKNQQKVHKHSFIFILSRLIVTLIVFAPAILSIAYITHKDNSRNFCYVSYSPASNSTITIQGIPLHVLNSSGLHGVSRQMRKSPEAQAQVWEPRVAPAQFVPPGFQVPGTGNPGSIIIVDRPTLQEKEAEILDGNPTGLIILDHESFRPSSPKLNLKVKNHDKINDMAVLMRMEDKELVREIKDGTLLWIKPDKPDMELSWKCSFESCLPPSINNGYLEGKQYRTGQCFWAGNECPKHNNTQEMKPFCNGPDVQVCPINGQEFGIFQSFSFYGIKRTLRSSPASCVAFPSFQDFVNGCDTGRFEWTEWLGWEVHWQDTNLIYRSRRRFCLVQQSIESQCLIEEQEGDRCCTGTCMDRSLRRC